MPSSLIFTRAGRPFLVPALFALITSSSLAQWTQTNGPLGGAVASIAVHGSHVLAGTEDGGTFHSFDQGQTWTRASQGLSMTRIKSTAVIGGTFFTQGLDKRLFRMTQMGGA